MWQLGTLLKGMVDSEEKSRQLSTNTQTPLKKCLHKTQGFIHENWKKIWIIALWLAINLGLFLWKYFQYKNRGAYQIMGQCLCFAKGAAETLKFNMALILLPMCRRTLTKLRSSFLSNFVPFDDNISFHKLVAAGVVAGVIVHVMMHVTCDFPRLVSCPKEKFMRILGSYFDYKQPDYPDLLGSVAGVTGIVMVALMAFVFTLALQSFRKSAVKLPWPFRHLAGFNTFWYAHHLLAVVYVLLVVHGYFVFLIKDWNKKTVCYVTIASVESDKNLIQELMKEV